MKKFDIEYQWTKYLELAGLHLETMHPVQVRETKRAFMAGMSSMLFLMTNDIANLDEDAGCIALAEIQEQLELFWKAESNSHDTNP